MYNVERRASNSAESREGIIFMRGQYILNIKTHCYHILGDCCYQNRPDPQNKVFCREDDLKSCDTKAWICSVCQKKREQREAEIGLNSLIERNKKDDEKSN